MESISPCLRPSIHKAYTPPRILIRQGFAIGNVAKIRDTLVVEVEVDKAVGSGVSLDLVAPGEGVGSAGAERGDRLGGVGGFAWGPVAR